MLESPSIQTDTVKALQEFLSAPKKVAITMHHNPDADALGSALGLARYLKKKGHQPTVISPSVYPAFLEWLPQENEVIVFEESKTEEIKQIIDSCDLVAYLDFSVPSRMEALEPLFCSVDKPSLLLDHHIAPSMKGTFHFWDQEAAATAQLVYRLIAAMGDLPLLDPHIGEAIYAGIVTDTGSFKYPSTSREVHEIAGHLIDIGVPTSTIHYRIYDNNSENRLRLLGYLLSEKLRVLPELRTAYFTLSAEEQERFSSEKGDTEGFVNYALSIRNIVFAAIFMEKEGKTKISFRSIGDFPVNEFAQAHFNGGGHKNAAGGASYASLEETEKLFLSLLPKYKEQLLTVKR
ncbi:phosphoesterase RecJ-like protein [Thermonema lapsum]|uniref:Phosphoesterase RecJ-like protein n=1 Tax=Thermonema lapsum TaxID=28195 RepID=A0A846MRB4_9BACT|nr:bifunctional oligoribonuclease/PAP phosphatase NrnA [Thermonema lapsum]NIK73999.1 phosphoesterase RecJ-like protein [Thermonema lapsum]